jgi:hypothetical protein
MYGLDMGFGGPNTEKRTNYYPLTSFRWEHRSKAPPEKVEGGLFCAIAKDKLQLSL